MQRLEVSGALRLMYRSLGVNGVMQKVCNLLVLITQKIFLKQVLHSLIVKIVKCSEEPFRL